MLDLTLRAVSARSLRGVDAHFERNTHTAVIGPPAAGASTLLSLIAGTIRPVHGSILIGTRDVTAVKASRRPLLYLTAALGAPDRWSVQHALIAAVRQRTLDRIDRQREYDLAVARWRLSALTGRRIGTLSTSERTLVHLARVELLHPAIVVADRLLEGLNPSLLVWAADQMYRVLRVIGATVVSVPASRLELGFADAVLVLADGTIVQRGRPAEVFTRPASEAAAAATGEVNSIPMALRGNQAESVMGAWEVEQPQFEGNGIALARPEDFEVAAPGEDSDLIFSVEEASFAGGRWLATGLLTGGIRLRVALPMDVAVWKGKLLALRYDASRFVLLPSQTAAPSSFPPAGGVPSLGETR
ncbi:MAG TPA: ATP-binding cassette domain-containing protein [Thermoanaerobaculia bacterium]|nr:ATP-binding cassette domain-containing protein [Thermoanaerobaculia bacterium]